MSNPFLIRIRLLIEAHRDGDEGPRAYVVPNEGAELTPEDILSFVATHMPAQKRLSGGVKLVSKLPRTEVSEFQPGLKSG